VHQHSYWKLWASGIMSRLAMALIAYLVLGVLSVIEILLTERV